MQRLSCTREMFALYFASYNKYFSPIHKQFFLIFIKTPSCSSNFFNSIIQGSMRNHYKLSNLLLSLGTTKQFGFTQKAFVLYLQLAILSFSLIRTFLIPWLLLTIYTTAHKITLCSNIFICNINSHGKHQQGIVTFTHLVTQAQ